MTSRRKRSSMIQYGLPVVQKMGFITISSVYFRKHKKRGSRNCGIGGYFRKPVIVDRLIEVIEQHC
jgi:hypothetical protein